MKTLTQGCWTLLAVGLGIGLGQSFGGNHLPSAAQAQGSGDAAGLTAAEAEDTAVVRDVREMMPAVVAISHDDSDGSGILIGQDGLILTNAHVVEGAQTVRVGLNDGRVLRGRVLDADDRRDLALVRVPGNGYPIARLGDSDRVDIGETAIAIGNPMGLDRSVTRGVVSGVNREPEDFDLKHLIQTDASINPGNSGGPLLDLRGRVIGINAAGLHSRHVSGLNFAIPISDARDFMHQSLAGSTRQLAPRRQPISGE